MFSGSALHRYYARVPSNGSSSSTGPLLTGVNESVVGSSTAPKEACTSSLGTSSNSKGMSVCNIPRSRRAEGEVNCRRSNPAVKLIEATVTMAPVTLLSTSECVEVVTLSSDGSNLSAVPTPLDKGKRKLGEFENLSFVEDGLTPGPIPVKKTKRSYEATRRFQENWAARLPWAELHKGKEGIYESVLCVCCTVMRKREIILAAKWDTLQKHAGKRKADKDMPRIGVKKGEWFVDKNCKHARNERAYAGRSCTTVIQQVCAAKGERARKKVQFATLLHLLHEGRPMEEYVASQSLMTFLHVPKLPTKHWNGTAGWQLAECLYAQVQEKTREIMKAARFFSITCDEVTTLDNESWISVHGYVCTNFARQPMLISLERVMEKATANHLTKVLVDATQIGGGIPKKEFASKLASFGADGVNTFQGKRNGVVKQLQDQLAPRMMGIHCMAHRTNLAVEALSKLPVVKSIEDMLGALYRYMAHSPKRHRQFQELAVLMNTKGLKILKNVKTRWISMLSPALRVMNMYNILLVKMEADSQDLSPTDGQTKEPKDKGRQSLATTNLQYLTDIKILLGLAGLLPMLRSMHSLMKFAQGRDIFVCDYVAAIQLCIEELQIFYIEETKSFSQDIFWDFKALLQVEHDHIPMSWTTASAFDLNSEGLETLHFTPGNRSIPATHVAADSIDGKPSPVTREIYTSICEEVKLMCRDAAKKLVQQLQTRFPASTLMDAFGFVYPQYWQLPDAESNFERHLAIIKEHYCHSRKFDIPKKVAETSVLDQTFEASNSMQLENSQYSAEGDEIQGHLQEARVAEPLFCARMLDEQKMMFKITMQANCMSAMKGDLVMNPVTRLWRRIDASGLLRHKLSEYIKVVELAVVTVLGSVEDERTFSTLSFMKNKLRNRLSTHLPLVVGMHAQDFYDLDSFPYDAAYEQWRSTKRTDS